MKIKLFLLMLVVMLSYDSQAQIADGSVAPDFTANDIFGNSHNLQSYLDDGKTVILNISATWCGPCWNYKETGALKDIYYSYGEHGSDEVVILYIEGDQSTGIDELYGISGNTIGNWVANTPFPIISDASIANDYQITYFPTVYRICPDGLVYEMGQLSNTDIISHIDNNCSSVELTDPDNHVAVKTGEVKVCEDGETTEVEVEITNYGNTVTSLDIDVDVNGTIETITESVNLNRWETTTVNLEIDANEGDEVFAEAVSVNNQTPNSSLAVSETTEVQVAAPTGRDIEVHISTDNYPGEISWNILDENGNVAATGGPYQEGTDDQWGGGGPDALTTIVHSINLPGGEQCFSIQLLDAFGDGWSLTNGDHNPGVEIFYEDESIFNETVGSFGDEITFSRSMKHLVTMNTEDFATTSLEVFPNPSQGKFNINSSTNFDVVIYDIQGKIVYQASKLNKTSSIELSESSGIYIAEFTSGSEKTTKKLIIK
ncbi:MAG: T9SS type A sorting domain-containing protein [Bacteroidota bacterium]